MCIPLPTQSIRDHPVFQNHNIRLTLKGRGYFTNEKDGGPISARSNGKRLIFSGY